jgi:hypothetical protein
MAGNHIADVGIDGDDLDAQPDAHDKPPEQQESKERLRRSSYYSALRQSRRNAAREKQINATGRGWLRIPGVEAITNY